MSLACTSAPCPGVAAQVELPGATHGQQGLVARRSRAELQGRFVPLSAAGVPGDSCSSLSIVKRKLRANPCATAWLGTQSVQIPVPALSC